MKDNWEKPRGKANHLTPAEIAKIKVAFNSGRRLEDIARELQCSSRTAARYYAHFRGNPHQKSEPERRPAPRKPSAPTTGRFYKSNFEL